MILVRTSELQEQLLLICQNTVYVLRFSVLVFRYTKQFPNYFNLAAMYLPQHKYIIYIN